MLYGNLRGFAEALISRNKYKAEGELRELADAIISGNKYKAPSGQLRDLADAIIHRDKYRVASGPLQDFANALITGDKYKAPSCGILSHYWASSRSLYLYQTFFESIVSLSIYHSGNEALERYVSS